MEDLYKKQNEQETLREEDPVNKLIALGLIGALTASATCWMAADYIVQYKPTQEIAQIKHP